MRIALCIHGLYICTYCYYRRKSLRWMLDEMKGFREYRLRKYMGHHVHQCNGVVEKAPKCIRMRIHQRICVGICMSICV